MSARLEALSVSSDWLHLTLPMESGRDTWMALQGDVPWESCDHERWGKRDSQVRFVGLGEFVSEFVSERLERRGHVTVRVMRGGKKTYTKNLSWVKTPR